MKQMFVESVLFQVKKLGLERSNLRTENCIISMDLVPFSPSTDQNQNNAKQIVCGSTILNFFMVAIGTTGYQPIFRECTVGTTRVCRTGICSSK